MTPEIETNFRGFVANCVPREHQEPFTAFILPMLRNPQFFQQVTSTVDRSAEPTTLAPTWSSLYVIYQQSWAKQEVPDGM